MATSEQYPSSIPEKFESTFPRPDDRAFRRIRPSTGTTMLKKFERYPLTFGPTHIEKLERLSRRRSA
jgi:hypothetical protein